MSIIRDTYVIKDVPLLQLLGHRVTKIFSLKTKMTKNTAECIYLQSYLIINEMIQIYLFIFTSLTMICHVATKMNKNIKRY